MHLPPYPFLNRCLFTLFPYTMHRLFPPTIDPVEDSVEVPEGVTTGEFEKPWHKRAWRKRFPELIEPFPKIPPRTNLRVPDEPLPGEWESPWWRIERWWSGFISDIKYRREKKKRGSATLDPPKPLSNAGFHPYPF